MRLGVLATIGKDWKQALERVLLAEDLGYEAEVAASRKAFAERDTKGAFDAISERMIRDLQGIGPIDDVREQLRERAALGADVQMIYMPRGDVASSAKQLEALIS